MRRQIDQIDKSIITLLKKRFIIVQKIGKFKKQHNLPIINGKRERELATKSIKNKLIKKIFIEIVRCSRLIQKKYD